MHDYRYTYGDRPLDGYTIQRAAGRGGFGEVYYAISDSGRQVAIKTVQNHEQIELRGIRQCMNLKSPHLVSVFDVKYNDKGQPFVIMEFVSGISLRDLLNEHSSGLGTQKAAFFLREIAKGLSHLHDCGIVHRDLKPGNIFYENGYVKIGDYGLTKAISTSQHSGQTITVGTVHYMAPEIGEGKYDCSIDIYALGILFYELLTGNVPFFGASPAEILMKHMKAEPELDGVDENFARVIRKALAKNPDERYKTVQEMVEDVFGTEHIRHSVSQFSPESLSIVAEKMAQKADRAQAVSPAQAEAKLAELGEKVGRRLGAAGDKLAEKMAPAGPQGKQQAGISQENANKLPADPGKGASPHRRIWALILALAFSIFPGLQRFYVGKMVTGIIWLITGGIFGIGQLIDIIMILAGRFRDAEGRSLIHWTEKSARLAAVAIRQTPQTPVLELHKAPSSPPVDAPAGASPDAQPVHPPQHRASSYVSDFISAVDQLNPLGHLLAAFGIILLVGMLMVGMVGVFRIPWLVSAGFPDPSVGQEMTKVLGDSWPMLVDRLIRFVCILLGLASATFFALGRRRAGATHIIRAVIGILLVLSALSILGDMIPQHNCTDGRLVTMWQNGHIGPAIGELFAHTRDDVFIPATCLFLTSIVILAWPSRRRSKLLPSAPIQMIPAH
jgi:hypothetical protein